MPKQIWKISNFHGGENTGSDPRDIADDQARSVEGFNVSTPGQMTLEGSLEDAEFDGVTSGAPNLDQIQTGYGLFFTKKDWPNMQEPKDQYAYELSDAPHELGESQNYLLTNEGVNGVAKIFNYKTSAWSTNTANSFLPQTVAQNSDKVPNVIYLEAAGAIRSTDTDFASLKTGANSGGGYRYKNSWYGFVNSRNRWTGTNADTNGPDGADGSYPTPGPTYNSWYEEHAHCYAPEAYGWRTTTSNYTPQAGRICLASESESAHLYTTSEWFNDDGAGADRHNNRWFLSINYKKTSEGGWRGFKRYYITYIYDEQQESRPSPFWSHTGSAIAKDDIWEDSIKSFKLYHKPSDTYRWMNVDQNDADGSSTSRYPLNHRITGGRIYFQEVDSEGLAYGDLFMLFEFNLDKGTKKIDSPTWEPWGDCSGSNWNSSHSRQWVMVSPATYFGDKGLTFRAEPTGPTYEAMSGIRNEETNVHCSYKTATVLNNRLYAGNIVQFNSEKTGGVSDANFKPERNRMYHEFTFHPDAMIKSPVNAYDVLPSLNKIEVTIGDGDEITCLENFADRLLQFKRKKLHIINCTQDYEFLEGTFQDKGVWGPAAVCKTDIGIAWVNTAGLYLYDGKTVKNLLEKGGKRLIKIPDWEDFIGLSPGVGYISRARKLAVQNTLSQGGTIYLYDMLLQSFTYLPGTRGGFYDSPGYVYTNFVNDANGDLVFRYSTGGNSNVGKKFNINASNKPIKWVSKDIDFGNPGVRKKVYKVYISYKDGVSNGTGGAGVQVKYRVNGGTTNYTFKPVGGGEDHTPMGDANDINKWTLAELKPNDSSEANNIYSFALYLYSSGNIDSTFEINDISIVYRMKNVK